MKRFWLLLLAFVLPMQMSWAATHFCDDDFAPAVAAMAGAGKGAHKHADSAQSKKSESKKADLSDCCGAAHGCHGLHHLMAHPEAHMPPAGQAEVAAPRDAPSTCGFLVSRVERPKWLAA